MDLEELNAEYINLKQEKQNRVEKVNKYESKLNELEAMPESDDKKEELESCNRNLFVLREEVRILGTKVEALKEQIKQDPEMRKYLDEAIGKKFGRRVETLTKEKQKLENIQKMITDHEKIGNNIKGIMNNTKDIKQLEKALKGLEEQLDDLKDENGGYKDPDKAKEIEEQIADTKKDFDDKNDKLNRNKDTLETFLEGEGNEYGVSMEDIEELVLNIDTKKRVNDLNKMIAIQIQGKENNIKNHEIALSKLTLQAENTEAGIQQGNIDNVQDTITDNAQRSDVQGITENTGSEQSSGDVLDAIDIEPVEKPNKKENWFKRNIINRVKNLFKKEKQPALKEADIESDTKPVVASTEEAGKATEEPTFREAVKDEKATIRINDDAGKYDIVKDIRREEEIEMLKNSKQARKDEGR